MLPQLLSSGRRQRFLPPVHFTHWIKDKIEGFLKDWVALKVNEYLGLKTHKIIFFPNPV